MMSQDPEHAEILSDVHQTSPFDTADTRIPLYLPEFSADPYRAYRDMRRRYGSMVPVELAPGVHATLVIGYRTALRILHDPEHFSADPREWQKDVPSDCPVLPLLKWRPTASRTSGWEHARYRGASSAALAAVDLHILRANVERIAIRLIGTFRAEVGVVDLVRHYAFPLAFDVMNTILGCPPEIAQKIAAAAAAIVEGVGAEEGNEMLRAAILELVTLKSAEPGDDLATRLLRHPAQLNTEELLEQFAVLYAGGIEPLQNLITNTLLLILTDNRFAGSVLDGSLSTRDALDEVLFNNPPMANLAFTYPRYPILIDDVWLPAHQPVVISLAGCNDDPTISTSDPAGNRAHLAWGAGPHVCPARTMAYLVAQDAIDQLLDALPEMRLAVPAHELSWRPGPFQRALVTLPAIPGPFDHRARF
ncbi:cytochrome P450 [Nocardia sp. NPDC004168]|uniref:cytochrome P450 n=1 Tax=Nocardia sp. NPDC004168 TaxID=3154452 RepID=UPI0033B91F5A